jgi:hypothetical protein
MCQQIWSDYGTFHGHGDGTLNYNICKTWRKMSKNHHFGWTTCRLHLGQQCDAVLETMREAWALVETRTSCDWIGIEGRERGSDMVKLAWYARSEKIQLERSWVEVGTGCCGNEMECLETGVIGAARRRCSPPIREGIGPSRTAL